MRELLGLRGPFEFGAGFVPHFTDGFSFAIGTGLGRDRMLGQLSDRRCIDGR